MRDSSGGRRGSRRSDARRHGVGDPYTPRVGSLPAQEDPARGSVPDVTEETLKTGTTTVGLTTADGVVFAADMRASLGGRFVANKNMQKVEQVHPRGAITIAGSVGGAQSFVRTLRAEVDLSEARRGEDLSIEALQTLAGNVARGGPFFAVTLLLGGVDEEGSHLASVYPDGAVSRDDYKVTGSGMQLAYGVLEREYDEELSNEEAVGVAARAIDSAIERDTASGDGITVAEITDEGVSISRHDDLADLV